MTKLHVYLNFAGNAEEAFNFYKSVFGGEPQFVRFKDMPMEGFTLPEAEQSKIMHVSLPISESSVLMASDTIESMGQQFVQGNNVNVSVDPDSRAEAERLFKALAAGGKVEMPIEDQIWGDYYGSLEDKFGVHWMVNYHEEK
jgi:PhnB protein